MLRQRLAVAAVALPLLGLLLLVPERAFSAVIALVIAVGAYELARAALPEAPLSAHVSAAVGAALLVAVTRTQEWFRVGTLIPAVALALFLVLRPSSSEPGSDGSVRLGFGDLRPAWWLVAVVYPGVLGAHFVLLRLLPEGQTWLLVLLASTFATDTGAYAAGRLFGKHPLAPAISPNKTREGALGGFVAGALATVAATLLLDDAPPAVLVAAIAVVLPLCAELGDLLESAVKRRLEVKDMSTLLPGHGGVMDRLDSLLATAPALYWLVRWLG